MKHQPSEETAEKINHKTKSPQKSSRMNCLNTEESSSPVKASIESLQKTEKITVKENIEMTISLQETKVTTPMEKEESKEFAHNNSNRKFKNSYSYLLITAKLKPTVKVVSK